MKPTIRVSIGGLAFNLEEDAYSVLNNYLKALRMHFSGNPEAEEIIADIESRLSELLQIRINSNDGVVSLADAQEIIKIMGNPKDFDAAIYQDANEEGAPVKGDPEYTDKDDPSQSIFKKKLYRDANNKILGGVCSGFGHYFKIDPTAIRIILAGLVIILFSFFSFKGAVTIIIGYLILWLIMPTARTFTQKLSMSGADPSIENIQDRTHAPQRKYRGSALGTLLNIFINIIIGFIALTVFLTLFGLLASLIWLHFDTEILNANNYLVLLGYNSINLKIAVILALCLPLVALLSLLMKVLFRSAFTQRTMFSFIIGLFIWVGSLFYIGNKSVKFAHGHRQQEDAIENVAVNTKSDTLIIRLGDDYRHMNQQPQNPAVFYRGEKMKDREVCILPRVKVLEDSLLTGYKVEIKKNDFADNDITARRKAENLQLDYSLNDSLMVINPKWYDNDDKWNLETFDVVITTPANKKVLIEGPLKNSYNSKPFRLKYYGRHGYNYHFNFD